MTSSPARRKPSITRFDGPPFQTVAPKARKWPRWTRMPVDGSERRSGSGVPDGRRDVGPGLVRRRPGNAAPAVAGRRSCPAAAAVPVTLDHAHPNGLRRGVRRQPEQVAVARVHAHRDLVAAERQPEPGAVLAERGGTPACLDAHHAAERERVEAAAEAAGVGRGVGRVRVGANALTPARRVLGPVDDEVAVGVTHAQVQEVLQTAEVDDHARVEQHVVGHTTLGVGLAHDQVPDDRCAVRRVARGADLEGHVTRDQVRAQVGRDALAELLRDHRVGGRSKGDGRTGRLGGWSGGWSGHTRCGGDHRDEHARAGGGDRHGVARAAATFHQGVPPGKADGCRQLVATTRRAGGHRGCQSAQTDTDR